MPPNFEECVDSREYTLLFGISDPHLLSRQKNLCYDNIILQYISNTSKFFLDKHNHRKDPLCAVLATLTALIANI